MTGVTRRRASYAQWHDGDSIGGVVTEDGTWSKARRLT